MTTDERSLKARILAMRYQPEAVANTVFLLTFAVMALCYVAFFWRLNILGLSAGSLGLFALAGLVACIVILIRQAPSPSSDGGRRSLRRGVVILAVLTLAGAVTFVVLAFPRNTMLAPPRLDILLCFITALAGLALILLIASGRGWARWLLFACWPLLFWLIFLASLIMPTSSVMMDFPARLPDGRVIHLGREPSLREDVYTYDLWVESGSSWRRVHTPLRSFGGPYDHEYDGLFLSRDGRRLFVNQGRVATDCLIIGPKSFSRCPEGVDPGARDDPGYEAKMRANSELFYSMNPPPAGNGDP